MNNKMIYPKSLRVYIIYLHSFEFWNNLLGLVAIQFKLKSYPGVQHASQNSTPSASLIKFNWLLFGLISSGASFWSLSKRLSFQFPSFAQMGTFYQGPSSRGTSLEANF